MSIYGSAQFKEAWKSTESAFLFQRVILCISTLFILGIILLNPHFVVALELRVAVEIDVRRLVVGGSSATKISNLSGKQLSTLTARKPYLSKSKKGKLTLNKHKASALWLDPGEGNFVYINRKWYRGRVLLISRGSRITAVNYVDLEEYLYSVLGSEMSGTWPLEALKAQAVAARTYALYKRAKAIKNSNSFDLGSTAHWQVYRGITREAAKTRQAVKETSGFVLTHEGKAILAAYHSSSGGHTESVQHIWGSRKLPYLQGVPDFDQKSSVYKWTKKFSSKEFTKKMGKLARGIGAIRGVKYTKLTPQGHVKSLNLIGTKKSKSMSGRAIQNAFKLRSSRFRIIPKIKTGSKPGSIPVAFWIEGRGFGHGLGMSQFGAKRLAERGYSFYQILMHYYRTAKLAKLTIK